MTEEWKSAQMKLQMRVRVFRVWRAYCLVLQLSNSLWREDNLSYQWMG